MQYVFSFASWQSHANVGLVHRWLYEKVGILHRDLSINNIMYRRIDGKVYGVLTDFDLSSWTASLTSDYTSTSQQRTGTPPYMAHGLLKGTDSLHLYRHDVESLFYIMLILAAHHEIHVPQSEMEKGGVRMRRGLEVLPYEEWFDQKSYKSLGSDKYDFLKNAEEFNLSPDFEDFQDWIESLHWSFQKGLLALDVHKDILRGQKRSKKGRSGGVVTPQFDNETLGGHVCYSALIDSARDLGGRLEGLVVRYDPTSAGVTEASV